MIPANRPLGQNRPAPQFGCEIALVVLGLVLLVPSLCCYLAGGIGAVFLHGHFATAPGPTVVGLAIAIAHNPRDPALAWPVTTRHLVPNAFVFYPLLLLIGAFLGALALKCTSRLTRRRRRIGFASPVELRHGLSAEAVRRRAAQVRPGLRHYRHLGASQAGLFLGRELHSRRALWASLEDSFLVLGPPRSGKGISLIIPSVLDAPGAAIVTSTRADVLHHTAAARRDPVEVFDPQGAAGWPGCLRWSPVHGCENPLTAILRARGFATGAGFEHTTTDANYWTGSAAAVIRSYLHAAALDHRSITDVLAWAGRPGDQEPIRILRRAPGAAPGWGDDLAMKGTSDPAARDSIWGGVRQAFDCFADPRVLATCSPPPEEAFDASDFLARRGTLYILGSADEQLSVASLITALIADLTERALRLAAASPHGRLDPPLTLFLDEAANIAPLASLPTLLSAGGGSGICTLVVLQSLAQARARWGADRADAIWDASTVRLVFGGLGHAEDLTRISRLIGEVDEEVGSSSRGSGGPTWSVSLRQRAVLPVEAIRSLPEGRVLVLHRRTPPVEARLAPWWTRPCKARINAALKRADALRDPGRNDRPPPAPSSVLRPLNETDDDETDGDDAAADCASTSNTSATTSEENR